MKKSTYFLLALVVLSLIYIFLFEKKHKTTEEINKSQKKVFADIPKDIEVIERKGFEDIKIEKKDENYFIVSPFYDPADSGSVTGFVEALREATVERIINNPDLEKLGLVTPNITVILKSKENEKTLLIGKNPPLEKGVYFKSDDKVGVLSEYTLDTIKRKIHDFRSKELCSPLKYEDVKHLTYLKNNEVFFEFEKRDENWYILHPFKDLADKRKTTFFVEDIVLWPIMNFDENDINFEKTNLDKSIEKIKIESTNGKEITIYIGGIKDEEKNFYYSKVSTRQGIFIISKNSVRNIDKNADDFISLEVFPFDFNGCEKLILEGEEKIVFENPEHKGWVEEKKKIKEDQIKTFMYTLEYLEGERKAEKNGEKPIFAKIIINKNEENIERTIWDENELLLVEIKERNLTVALSKDESERLKNAIRTIFLQYKENGSN